MSDKPRAAQGSAAAEPETKFKNMRFPQKLAFVGKICIFFLTLGFAYPNIFVD